MVDITFASFAPNLSAERQNFANDASAGEPARLFLSILFLGKISDGLHGKLKDILRSRYAIVKGLYGILCWQRRPDYIEHGMDGVGVSLSFPLKTVTLESGNMIELIERRKHEKNLDCLLFFGW